MSEPMFPSSSAPAGPAAAEPAPGRGNRKALLAVGGAVAALAVGAGAFVMLTGSGGGSGDQASAPVPRASAPAPAPSASTKPAVTTIKTVTVAARDPFAPLFPAPAAAAVAPAAPSTTTTTTQVQTAVGQTPTGPKVALTVSAIDPTKQTAKVAVNGTTYSVSVGTTFAKTFMLYSVFNGQCVGVLFGDQSVPVCTSQPQLVSP